MFLLNLDQSGEGSDQPKSYPETPDSDPSEQPPQGPVFETLDNQSRIMFDLLRALLVFLALVVAAGFALILMPESTVDNMTQSLRSRRGSALQEKIAFLYLGDEVKENNFHVRGVVRNISSAPIERMDAAIRLYSQDGTVLQTALVRMSKETIAPDEIAQFDLFYPDYRSEFGSYAVEFKLRDGNLVPYKDMRTIVGN